MEMAMPYYHKNKEWYYFDDKEDMEKLTEEGKKAPYVIKSYIRYNKKFISLYRFYKTRKVYG